MIEEKSKLERKDKKDEKVVKITVTRKAAMDLLEVVESVNRDFEAGKVHRQDVASWILSEFKKTQSEGDLQRIRHAHFSEAQMLEAVYRRMRESGEVPQFLREALQKEFNNPRAEAKKVKKKLTKVSTNDELSKHEGDK